MLRPPRPHAGIRRSSTSFRRAPLDSNRSPSLPLRLPRGAGTTPYLRGVGATRCFGTTCWHSDCFWLDQQLIRCRGSPLVPPWLSPQASASAPESNRLGWTSVLSLDWALLSVQRTENYRSHTARFHKPLLYPLSYGD